MSKPRDIALYEKVKKEIYRKHPKHSAYRSGLLVQAYKKEYSRTRSGSPYSGRKPKRSGLSRWYAEKWRNQRGEVGYRYKSDVYRPTRRITTRTPVTFSELRKSEIRRARRAKSRSGRVKRFRK
jgi:hypothetical protein